MNYLMYNIKEFYLSWGNYIFFEILVFKSGIKSKIIGELVVLIVLIKDWVFFWFVKDNVRVYIINCYRFNF